MWRLSLHDALGVALEEQTGSSMISHNRRSTKPRTEPI